jgi:predicted Zn-dependent protease
VNDVDATAREAVALGGQQGMPPADIPGVERFANLASTEEPTGGSPMNRAKQGARRRQWARWALPPALATVTACAISQQQEVQLGDEYAAQIAEQLPLVRDPAVVQYITALGTSLAQVTDTRGLTWQFTVVDSREVNAFAVPGGWIYVNRGLIERAENLSQLAGVLGHEIGHVTRRHSVQQMQQAQGANAGLAVVCTLTNVCEGGAGQAAINVGGSALFAKFSRSDEQEADEESVRTVVQAGIHPDGIPGMFRLLIQERERNPNALEAFFATHPMAEDRIAATEALIATYSPSQLRNLRRDAESFQAFRRRLLALPPPPPAGKQP